LFKTTEEHDRPNSQEVAPHDLLLLILYKKERKKRKEKIVKRERILYFFVDSQTFLKPP